MTAITGGARRAQRRALPVALADPPVRAARTRATYTRYRIEFTEPGDRDDDAVGDRVPQRPADPTVAAGRHGDRRRRTRRRHGARARDDHQQRDRRRQRPAHADRPERVDAAGRGGLRAGGAGRVADRRR